MVPLIARDRFARSRSRDAIGFQDKSQFDERALRVEHGFAGRARFFRAGVWLGGRLKGWRGC